MNDSLKKCLKRRDFIGNIAKVSLVGMLPTRLTFAAKNNTNKYLNDSLPILLTLPYLQNLRSTEVTIVWITSVPCNSWVECSDKQGNKNKYVTVHKGLIDSYGYINKIKIYNLLPNTLYSYKVFSHEIVNFNPYMITWGEMAESDSITFKTLDEQADGVSCVVLNDIHDRPTSFPLLFSLIKDFKFDFVTLNGDMFNYENDQNQLIDHLLNPLSKLFSTVTPFYFLRGNHETRGKFARKHFDYVFESPGYYSFVAGRTHFTFIDSGEDKVDNHKEYSGLVSFDEYREKQAKWFESEIKKEDFKKAKFRVVFMHIPPFESGDWHGTMHCRQLFHPLFNKGKIDLLICGHTHVYGIHLPNEQHNYPIVIGGGPLEGKRTIITLKVDKEKLNLEMLRDDGIIVGNLQLKAM